VTTKVTHERPSRTVAVRVRNTLRIPAPGQTMLVPVPEVPLFLALADAVRLRHERGAERVAA